MIILALAAATKNNVIRPMNRASRRVSRGDLLFLRVRPTPRAMMVRFRAQRRLISKKPRRAYSARVKSSGRIPEKPPTT